MKLKNIIKLLNFIQFHSFIHPPKVGRVIIIIIFDVYTQESENKQTNTKLSLASSKPRQLLQRLHVEDICLPDLQSLHVGLPSAQPLYGTILGAVHTCDAILNIHNVR
jgi:hypothetical protein